MKRRLFALMLLACAVAPAAQAENARGASRPGRIISLDVCADQFVLALADRDQIAALSPEAQRGYSYLASNARGLPQVRAAVEDVIAREPDLIVRAYGGGAGAGRFFRRAGLQVAEVEFSNDFDGVRANVRRMAQAFGHGERGEAMIAAFDTRLRAAARPHSGANALYMTPAGLTTGSGSLVDRLLAAAGLSNYAGARPGWRPLPLEDIALRAPDIAAPAYFGDRTNHVDAWSPARHPVARRQLRGRNVVAISGASTACGGWFVADAVEALAAAHDDLARRTP